MNKDPPNQFLNTECKSMETSHKMEDSGEASDNELNTQSLRREITNFKTDLDHKIYLQILKSASWH